ncbi:uncharacterized protein K460DRAFT_364833 [Cucurbitaria berberidis CBS 394.84]|uniref:non-specific serine/threonine protein kinase n=1 Tax=Cucurbitaria berberidis CBS 394.84 TaxID=1168544 RepID=A0A9P4GNF8_9PLEO|nr:uncharacterized protein K460DRAFT_364833 [Cucurbitaria berberidis CBS 394.84]KAF1848882.1 hypothetical protein K460DRAFT_364833 [Cucurbitaria berberidis CBS 394.84]
MSDCNTTSSPHSIASTLSLTAQNPDHDLSESEESDYGYDCKPRLPYVKGFTFTAHRHEPPAPFGIGYSTESPLVQENWKLLSQTEYCLSQSLLEGQTYLGEVNPLTITSTIRTGYDRGAQLVVVNDTMVAKIYDPLYYEGINEFGYREDVITNADGDYSREAAAYMELQNSPAAKGVTPAFHGTWTIEVETVVGKVGQQKTNRRHVRLILIERLLGDSMENICTAYLRRPVRSLILKKALHAEAIICNAGVMHRDFCPRNIIVLGDEYSNPNIPIKDIKVEVKVFDFNIASVVNHPYYEKRRSAGKGKLLKEKWHPRLVSPILRYFGHMSEFSTEGWCSDSGREADKWLWRHFRKDERFIPVIWDPNTPEKRPVYQGWNDLVNGSDSGVSVSSEAKGADERCSYSSSTRTT